MKNSLQVPMIVLLLAGGAATAAIQPQHDARVAHPLLQDAEVEAAVRVLDSWIKATMENREQPGLSIGIVHDQDLIWAKGYGFADIGSRTPATPATLYRIASISKLFTATAVMQLRDAGKLQLDDPVAKHLPWFQPGILNPEDPPVTIRHLLTHTSGLPREATGVNWTDLTFPTRHDMIQNLPDQRSVFPAETEWKYSNLALAIAGEIVAAVSGESWPQYVERHILQPLDMTRTTPLPDRSLPGLALGYGRRVPGKERSVQPFVDIEAERPAGNLASNVEDLARFVALQFRGGKSGRAQILKAPALTEMHRVHWLRQDWQSGWGLGFAVRRVGEETRVGHGGSLPGHRTMLELVPDKKLGVIALTNANDGEPGLYLDKVFEIVGPAIARATAAPKETSEPHPDWERYVGVYTWEDSDVQVMILGGKLTLIMPEAANPWESRVTLEPVSEHTFRAVPNQWSYSLNAELLTFELDTAGRVTRFGSPVFYWVRK